MATDTDSHAFSTSKLTKCQRGDDRGTHLHVMRRYLLWLLTLITSIPVVARDFSYSYDGKTLKYEVVDEEAKTCTVKSNYVSGTVVIPATASDGTNNFLVTAIKDFAFQYCSGITSITIPDWVSSIGNSAFSGCSGLKSINIPNSVTTIGDLAFDYCLELKSISIPSSVTSIGATPFSSCNNLESINVDNQNKNYSSVDGVLFDKSKQTIITYPIKKGGSTYSIPNSVTTIGNLAFDKCTSLTSVTIPNSVTTIGNSAFSGCKGLTSVTIPTSVTTIGNSAFSGCMGLASVTIPTSVTTIGNSAFSSCIGITSLTIPNSLTTIGEYTFSYCSGLASVTIPSSVTSIGKNAFFNCTNLASVTIPSSVTSIGSGAFYYCSRLASITIPESVKSIGSTAFSGCSKLTSLTIPSSVTSIGSSAFRDCTNLASIIVDDQNGNYCSIDGVLFNKSKNRLIAYPAKKSSNTYVIPNSVTTIDEAAFEKCTGLTSITISNSVKTISNSAFYYCSGLTSLTISKSITSIEMYAFGFCSSLSKIYCLPEKVPTSDSNIFYYVPSSCKLYVHKNSIDAYKKATGWKDFTNVIGYYEKGGENEYLSVQNFEINPEEETYMPVYLNSERNYSDFSIDVYLPEGINALTKEDGKVDVKLAQEDSKHIISATIENDGAIRVNLKSTNNAIISNNGNEILFYLRVKRTDSNDLVDKYVGFHNAIFKDANYGYLFKDSDSKINDNISTSISDIESEQSTAIKLYDLKGLPVATPQPGQIYIRVQGSKVTKIVF